eukprot:6172227-Pleurochrysis_carterae.AAC.4
MGASKPRTKRRSSAAAAFGWQDGDSSLPSAVAGAVVLAVALGNRATPPRRVAVGVVALRAAR